MTLARIFHQATPVCLQVRLCNHSKAVRSNWALVDLGLRGFWRVLAGHIGHARLANRIIYWLRRSSPICLAQSSAIIPRPDEISGLVRFRWVLRSAMLTLTFACGCTPPLLKYRTDVPAMQLAVLGQPAVSDGRVRFREIYCSVLASAQEGDVDRCDVALTRLSDEPPRRVDPPPLPAPDPRLHILFIPGAFGECFKDAVPFPAAMPHLSTLGYRVRVVGASGRSSSTHNARQIAEAVSAETIAPGEKLVLVGYSKGVPDIFEFLAGYPELVPRVDAVVSIAGAVNGTPIADAYASLYALVSGIDLKICAAGDGGVVDSLSRDKRLRWLASHKLPSSVRYFSVGSFVRAEETARLMDFTKSSLSRAEPLNDGQTIFYDQLIPGSTLLGYANGDHWAIVLPLQDKWTYWGANPAGTLYPRDLLFEAVVLYVSEILR